MVCGLVRVALVVVLCTWLARAAGGRGSATTRRRRLVGAQVDEETNWNAPRYNIKEVHSYKQLQDLFGALCENNTIPAEIKHLTKLTMLSLPDAGLVGSVPPQVGELKNLRVLDLRGNALTGDVPESLGDLRLLKTLTLSKNRLTSVPSSIGKLKNLQRLSLNNNQLTSLPEEIGNIGDTLLLARLHDNLLTRLPSSFHQLTGLYSLSLSRNRLVELDAGIGNHLELRWLWLRGNQLTRLPDEVTQLVHLQGLSCSENMLEALPERMHKLSQLLELYADNNRLLQLPAQLDKLPRLRVLHLQDNLLTLEMLERSVKNCIRLESLSLSNNPVGAFPYFVYDFSELTEFYLSNAKADYFPWSVGNNLDNLLKLDLSSNNITFLRGKFYQGLKKLEELNLSNNRMDRIDKRLYKMPKIKTILLAGNKIDALPDELGQLLTLERLDISRNFLQKLPETVEKLEWLKVLDMHDNPFVCDRRVMGWFKKVDALVAGQGLQIPHQDQTLCANVNEFGGQPVHRIRFHGDEPGTHPDLVDAQAKTSRSVRLAWTMSGDPDLYDGYEDEDGDLGRNQVPSESMHAKPTKNGREKSTGDDTDDNYDDYGDGWESYEPQKEDIWPCDALGFKRKFESRPKKAFEIEVVNIGQSSVSNHTACTWDPSSAIITGLQPNQVYEFSVRAINVRWDLLARDGSIYLARRSAGPQSLVRRVKTLEDAPGSAPRFLEQVLSKEHSLTLRWKEPSVKNGVIEQYELRDVVTGASVFSPISMATLDGLKPGANVTLQCRAYTKAGAGPWSASFAAATEPSCPSGFQRQDSPYTCIPVCPEGAFIAKSSHENGLCTRCPSDFPRTLGGRAGNSSSDCVVDRDYFQLLDPQDPSKRLARERMACDAIPGLLCNQAGLTTATVGLRPGFWRMSLDSLDVRACPVERFCTPSTWRNGGSRRLTEEQKEEEEEEMVLVDRTKIDQNSSRYCAPHHQGIMCIQCEKGYALQTIEGEEELCRYCDESSIRSSTIMIGVLSIVGAISVLLPALWVVYFVRRERACKTNGKDESAEDDGDGGGRFCALFLQRACCSRFSRLQGRAFAVQFRLVLGFFQVYAQFVITTGLASAGASPFLAAIVDLDFAALFDAMKVDCVYSLDFYNSLFVYTMYPIVCALLMGAALCLYVSPVHPGLLAQAFAEAVWLFLQILFCVYPGLSSRIFSTFLFDKFPSYQGDPEPYTALRADYEIDYSSDESQFWRAYAIVMIILYPVGVVLLFLALTQYHHILSARQDVLGKSLPKGRHFFMKAVDFLPRPYVYAWFESYELLRKLVLTSVFVLLFQLSEEGAKLFFVFIGCFFLWLLKTLKPYREARNHWLAEISLTLIVIMGFLPMIPNLDATWGAVAIVIIAVLEAMAFSIVLFLQLREVFSYQEAMKMGLPNVEDDDDDETAKGDDGSDIETLSSCDDHDSYPMLEAGQEEGGGSFLPPHTPTRDISFRFGDEKPAERRKLKLASLLPLISPKSKSSKKSFPPKRTIFKPHKEEQEREENGDTKDDGVVGLRQKPQLRIRVYSPSNQAGKSSHWSHRTDNSINASPQNHAQGKGVFHKHDIEKIIRSQTPKHDPGRLDLPKSPLRASTPKMNVVAPI